MKYFRYNIKEDEIAKSLGEVPAVPVGFIEYQSTMMGHRVFYKLNKGKVIELIAEGGDEVDAERRAEEFLAGLHVNLSLGMP